MANRDNLEISTPSSAHQRRFNGAMLATAREALFLSQGELAEKLHLSQPLVARWEVESSQPNEEQIDLLSRELAVRKEFFFVDRPRRLASMSDYYHRAFAKATRRDVKAIHARCAIIDIQIDRLLALGELVEDVIPDI
ncbi:MAG: helix-turn-helix transcriptional regulator, partial [Candidatus Diapherotrites archaeon]|nr:helix-turn-helix transcriptional regulator [Candidatus Diapherotrites archaeon]